jgi:hypothetical protein
MKPKFCEEEEAEAFERGLKGATRWVNKAVRGKSFSKCSLLPVTNRLMKWALTLVPVVLSESFKDGWGKT